MIKVIYVTPECWDLFDGDMNRFEKLSEAEKLEEATKNDLMEIYSLETFEEVYNHESYISDLGYIYFVHC